MKICPACNQKYADDTLNFCLSDGVGLTEIAESEQKTVLINQPRSTSPNQPFGTQPGMATAGQYGMQQPKRKSRAWLWILLIFGGLILPCGGGLIALMSLMPSPEDYVFNTNEIFNTNTRSNSNTNSTSNTETNTIKPTDSNGKLTKENYDKLKNGMSYKQVVEIFGSEGEEISKSEAGAYSTAVYMWQGDDFTIISAVFMNDKLLSKTNSGL